MFFLSVFFALLFLNSLASSFRTGHHPDYYIGSLSNIEIQPNCLCLVHPKQAIQEGISVFDKVFLFSKLSFLYSFQFTSSLTSAEANTSFVFHLSTIHLTNFSQRVSSAFLSHSVMPLFLVLVLYLNCCN